MSKMLWPLRVSTFSPWRLWGQGSTIVFVWHLQVHLKIWTSWQSPSYWREGEKYPQIGGLCYFFSLSELLCQSPSLYHPCSVVIASLKELGLLCKTKICSRRSSEILIWYMTFNRCLHKTSRALMLCASLVFHWYDLSPWVGKYELPFGLGASQ